MTARLVFGGLVTLGFILMLAAAFHHFDQEPRHEEPVQERSNG